MKMFNVFLIIVFIFTSIFAPYNFIKSNGLEYPPFESGKGRSYFEKWQHWREKLKEIDPENPILDKNF